MSKASTTLSILQKTLSAFRYFITFCLLSPLAVSTTFAQSRETVVLITYHTHPPFITQAGAGLTYDLANYLNTHADGTYEFQVRPMSRPRINLLIAESKTYVVPWVNQVWFQDKAESKYLWTQNALMIDTNTVISRIIAPVNFTGPVAFSGLTFGGIRGHRYAQVDDFINTTHAAKRIDADRHLSNIRKLSKARIDVTIMPSSAARYFIAHEDLTDTLYISPLAHSTYSRRMFVNNNRYDVQAFLDRTIANMANDPHWQKTLDQYK